MRTRRILRFALMLSCALWLSACGGKPTVAIAEAEKAIADARVAKNCVAAKADYDSAERMLARAKELAKAGKDDEAREMAAAAKKVAIKAQNKALLDPSKCKELAAPDAPVDYSDLVDESGPAAQAPTDMDAEEALKTIFFDYDSSDLTPEARETLAANARYLKGRQDVRVTIEGHCDKRGSTEYNLALGEKRAQIVRRYLQQLGVDPNRISILSYGEESPLDFGDTEAAFARNRRAEFTAR